MRDTISVRRTPLRIVWWWRDLLGGHLPTRDGLAFGAFAFVANDGAGVDVNFFDVWHVLREGHQAYWPEVTACFALFMNAVDSGVLAYSCWCLGAGVDFADPCEAARAFHLFRFEGHDSPINRR